MYRDPEITRLQAEIQKLGTEKVILEEKNKELVEQLAKPEPNKPSPWKRFKCWLGKHNYTIVLNETTWNNASPTLRIDSWFFQECCTVKCSWCSWAGIVAHVPNRHVRMELGGVITALHRQHLEPDSVQKVIYNVYVTE